MQTFIARTALRFALNFLGRPEVKDFTAKYSNVR